MKRNYALVSNCFRTYLSYVELSLLSNQKSTFVGNKIITYLLTNYFNLLIIMKKFLSLVLLMVLMTPFALRADEVIIGTGTDSHYYHPFTLDYKYTWSEAIYYESEIGGAGTISEISFYCSQANPMVCRDLRIYLGVSDKDNMASTSDWLPENELTLVYQGPSDLILGKEVGWQTFVLDQPFVYEGSDNLIVAIGKVSDNYTYSMKWAYTWTNNSVLFRDNDNNPEYGYHPGNGSGTQSSRRANLKLEIEPIEDYCTKVESITIEDFTNNTVTVSIVGREGQDAWDYYIAPAGITPDDNTVPTAANVAETTYTFTGLVGATEYKVWVRAICADLISGWKSQTVYTFPDWEGEGTASNPFKFYTVEDILNLNAAMDLGWSTQGVYFSQMNDIEGLNVAICPIGTSFKGVWEGNGYTVDLNISGDGWQGLFASMSPGAIVRNVTITGNINSTSQYNGGITGYMYSDAIIENCVNYATIQSNGSCTAGITGYVNTGSTVENCVNYGDILGYGERHGGITGCVNNTSYVTNCANYGKVQGSQYTGGVAGECNNHSVVTDCSNKGYVESTSSSVGGVVGSVNAGHIYNSYNVGDVKGTHDTGGVVGKLQTDATSHGVIENVYNGGTVEGTNGWLTNTGSVVGYASSGTIKNAYYLAGTHELAYGNDCTTTNFSKIISFTEGQTPTVFVLAEANYGTTDLLTALNAYNDHGENEWLEDIYSNNNNMPTFNLGSASALSFNPSTISMGARPIGAVVAPVKVTLTNTSLSVLSVSNIDFGTSFIVLDEKSDNPELPFSIGINQSVDIYITTDSEANVAAGLITENIVVTWNQNGESTAEISVEAYNPVATDVVETAGTISNLQSSITVNAQNMKSNYQLPGGGVAGADVVYKVNVTKDQLLNVEVVGENPKVAIYAEDFSGKQYPAEDNNYTGPAVNETSGSNFYFNQAQFVTHPGGGLNGADNSVCNYYMGWCVDRRYNYSMADDFYSDEDMIIDEVEFYAYQTNALTTSEMTGLYIRIYDGKPNEGGQVVWGDFQTNLLTHSSWTGAYRVSPGFELDPDCPIMRVVASGLGIELPAGTYWIEYAAVGNLNFGYTYGIPRSIKGEFATGNALLYNNNEGWYGMYDSGYGQGVPMILRTGFTDYNYNSRTTDASFGGTDPIAGMTITPGTYYLVASSTSPQFTINVNTETIPVPEQASCVFPANNSYSVKAPLKLTWALGRYTTEYQLLFGTTNPPTEVLQDWTSDLVSTHNIFELENNKNYYWQVNERNESGETQGAVWKFVTSLDPPQNVAASNEGIYAGDKVTITWSSMSENRALLGYNLYKDGVKLNNNYITATSYEVSGLTYNMTPGYGFTVSAVYDEGESAQSEPVYVYVTDKGSFSGRVFEIDGTTPISGVTVRVLGRDEHNRYQAYEYVTNASGNYGGSVYAGYYKVLAKKDGYQDNSYVNAQGGETFDVEYNETIGNINISLYEAFNPVAEVTAEETADSKISVNWSLDKVDMTRELKSYKVYRANNLNDEYTSETVDLINGNVTGTSILDTEWSSLETGVYKWGVAAVYEGNRRSETPRFELGDDFVAYEDATYPYEGEVEITADFNNTIFRGSRAYANNLVANNMPLGYLSLDIEKPFEAVTVNSTVVNRGGEYYDGVFYGYNNNYKYYHIDAETGVVLAEKSVVKYMTEMAFDYSTRTMYGIYSGDLYTIDIESGDASFIGELGQTIMAFAIDLQGNAYGIAIGYGDLYSINLYDATCTYIGGTDMGCNYIQCAGFDHHNGTMYWWQFYSTDDMGLYKVDVTTGEAQMVTLNTGEITSFFIPYEEGDPTYPFQSFNESPIVWSNTIDKDMVTSVEVSATTNSGDSAENTTVKLINLSEPGMGHDYIVVLDETGHHEWTEFRKGTYRLTISKPGFISDAIAEVIEIWDETSINSELTENIAPVSGLYVSPTGWAMWIESGTEIEGDEFEYGFEGGYDGWTMIDANADGHTWYHNSVSTQHGVTSIASHSGTGHMYSESYCNIIATPIAPDDYLVSPDKVKIGSNAKLSFWACAQDEYYAAEHFGVALSFNGNENAADFTTIAEWTLHAKSGDKGDRDDSKGEGSWYQYTVDLTHYAGTEAWIAIRHFNSWDQYVILIDDIKLTNSIDGRSVGFYQVLLNGIPEDDVTVPYYQHENLIIGELYTTSVTTYYTTGISNESTYTWTYAGCDNFEGVTEFTGEYKNGKVVLNWTLPIVDNGEKAPAGGDWLYYDNGSYIDAIGGPQTFYWGIKLRAADLAAYTQITKISHFDNVATNGNFYIYSGGEAAPGTLVHTQAYSSTGANTFAEYELTTPIEVNGENIWIVFGTTQGDVVYPAACSGNTGDADGRWISMDNTTWEDVATYSIDATWLIRAYAEGGDTSGLLGVMLYRDGELITPKPVAATSYSDPVEGGGEFEYEARVVYGGERDVTYYAMSCPEDITVVSCDAPEDLRGEATYNADGSFGVTLTWSLDAKSYSFDHYNIYRGTSNNNYELVGETTEETYFDELSSIGTYYYQVTAVYDGNTECESAPANAYDTDENYVVVDVTSIYENGVDGLIIYPNPTSDKVNIKAESMTRITITNTLGQVVYDNDVDGDNEVIDMSQYEGGVYMVRITTENGVAVKRITVVR